MGEILNESNTYDPWAGRIKSGGHWNLRFTLKANINFHNTSLCFAELKMIKVTMCRYIQYPTRPI